MLEPHLEVGAYVLTKTSAAINQRFPLPTADTVPQQLYRSSFV
jgi:hypothetical protein